MMAKTGQGKKKVYVGPHTKKDGTRVGAHHRSTPNAPAPRRRRRR